MKRSAVDKILFPVKLKMGKPKSLAEMKVLVKAGLEIWAAERKAEMSKIKPRKIVSRPLTNG